MKADIIHHFSNGLYTKEMHVPAGNMVMKHLHQHDHQSILCSGTAIVVVGEKAHKYTGPVVLNIKGGIEHEVFAETDIVWLCQHITDITDSSLIDEVLIKEH